MSLQYGLLKGMERLDAQALMAAPAVTMDGEDIGPAARALIWAQAVDEGYRDPAKVIEDWSLTGDANLSVCVLTTMDKLKADFEDAVEQDPDLYPGGFEEYWGNFPITIALPDGRWLVWME